MNPQPIVKELTYEQYQERQYAETQLPQLLEQGMQLHFGNKFMVVKGEWQPIPYPGYALVSLPDDHSGNNALINQLVEIQQDLIKATRLGNKLFPLPAESLHQTVANTLSGDRYIHHIVKTGLLESYPHLIRKATERITASERKTPIVMKLIGLSIFGSALGILGVFDNRSDFQSIVHFRDQFYNQPVLNKIGVRRTRPFIGHITLLYFGHDIQVGDGHTLAFACAAINRNIQANPILFFLEQTQLRQYMHLGHFEYQPHFPEFSFVREMKS